MSNPFKAAQRITCVDNEDCSKLNKGSAYTVKFVKNNMVYTNEVAGGYFGCFHRF